jgi:hypothetical protein
LHARRGRRRNQMNNKEATAEPIVCVACQKPITNSEDAGKLHVQIEFYDMPDALSGNVCSQNCVSRAMRQWANAFDGALAKAKRATAQAKRSGSN